MRTVFVPTRVYPLLQKYWAASPVTKEKVGGTLSENKKTMHDSPDDKNEPVTPDVRLTEPAQGLDSAGHGFAVTQRDEQNCKVERRTASQKMLRTCANGSSS